MIIKIWINKIKKGHFTAAEETVAHETGKCFKKKSDQATTK